MNLLSFNQAGLMKAICGVACGLALVASSPAVLAEKADKDKPINLEADSAQYDDVKQVMVAEGRVLVTKGTLVLRATKVEQREDPEGNQFMVATAKPAERVFFRQKREALDEFMEGEAERIDYDGKADVMRLSGKAVLRRLRGAILADESMGNLIVFNNTTETMNINGSPASASAPPQRVRMMLSPKADKSLPPTGGVTTPVLRGTSQIEVRQP
ncbi:MAG: lipopolysaccharide transport periplasmic protein LptA [Pseudomonadota bacterium]|jgi:lipopolysaccharide export system protein LptA